jgi:site-specific recombinase XerD
MDVYDVVDLRKSEGLRDYCLLHLLFDSGARATEVATLNLGKKSIIGPFCRLVRGNIQYWEF